MVGLGVAEPGTAPSSVERPPASRARQWLRTAPKTVAALALLTAALPANLALTAVALARCVVVPTPAPLPTRRRTVLVSGGKMTKALQLCRSFHAAGHRVVLVETAKYRRTGHRFSRAVDAFHVVPDPTDDNYAEALLAVVMREAVDVYVPVCSPAASWYDAKAAEILAPHCEVLHATADTVRMLDDKYEFATAAAALGLSVPETVRVTSPTDVAAFPFHARPGDFVLKNLAYDPTNRLDLTPLPRPTFADTQQFAASKAISPRSPWILQSLVHGREYCTHSTVRDGQIVAYVCCESSAFQINYQAVDHPAIEAWVRIFVARLHLTGQISFDFIEDEAGRVFAIECNPRTHSAITTFHDEPGLAAAYLGDRPEGAPVLRPRPESRPTYWLYHEIWRMIRHPGSARSRVNVILAGKEAIFDWADPLPFLLEHHLQIPGLLLHNLALGNPWTRIDFNIGKLVEAGGD